jgi:hypothetical protein
MPVPYQKRHLFALNPQLGVTKRKVQGIGDVVIIENFFAYPDDIALMLEQSWVQSWKNSPTSSNFVDYYDCRYELQQDHSGFNSNEYQQIIRDLAHSKLGIRCHNREVSTSFNVFQWIDPPKDDSIQMKPHIDGREILASIVYLDKFSDGGTAFYSEYEEDASKPEDEDIRYDISKNAKLIDVVEANFNRCVIYPGSFPHGGYISNHNTYTGDNWRLNMVMFMGIMMQNPGTIRPMMLSA